jgi:hypothetical protein
MEDFKMKVKFTYPVRTLSGKEDDTVFGSYRHDNLCLAKKFVYPTLTANNHNVGLIAQNLASVYHNVSPTYLQDLEKYVERNGKENVPNTKIIPTDFSLFIKMMYAWFKSDPEHVDLTTVTIPDIIALDADVQTISSAVTAGFLPHIAVSDDLTSGIQ